MAVPFLDLKRQYMILKDELEKEVLEVIRSGMYIGGNHVIRFENAMKDYLGVKNVISCANGTDALVLALRACGLQAGDEVITSPFTFFATSETIASIGAIPVFVDINEFDFTIDVNKIEEKITKNTKAIIPIDIFGCPCDIDTINNIAQKYKLKVIDDAAQAIGAKYKNKMVGSLCDISCFSFYPTKNLGAFGDGGMITTNDDKLATILLALKEHGASSNGAKAREYLYGIKDEFITEVSITPGSLYNPYKYYNYIIGYNSRLDAIQAAVLNIKLKYLDDFNYSRKMIADKYTKYLKDYVIVPMPTPNVKSCYHQYAIRTEKKEELIEYLASKSIGSGSFYPIPLHLQKAFESLGYCEGSLPVAEMVSTQTVCLPIFPELTDAEISEVIEAVIAFERGV